MLQDLAFGRLENEFRNIEPSGEALVACIKGSDILLKRNADDTLELPRYEQVCRWAEDAGWEHWNEQSVRYIFRMQGIDYFLWMGNAGACGDGTYGYEAVRPLRQMISKDVCYAVMTACP